MLMKILVLEQNGNGAQHLMGLLRSQGHIVQHVRSFGEMCTIYERWRPHLVVVGQHIDGRLWTQVVALMRENILFKMACVLAIAPKQHVALAGQYNVYFVGSPYTEEELISKLTEITLSVLATQQEGG
jgi:hypothetical protein